MGGNHRLGEASVIVGTWNAFLKRLRLCPVFWHHFCLIEHCEAPLSQLLCSTGETLTLKSINWTRTLAAIIYFKCWRNYVAGLLSYSLRCLQHVSWYWLWTLKIVKSCLNIYVKDYKENLLLLYFEAVYIFLVKSNNILFLHSINSNQKTDSVTVIWHKLHKFELRGKRPFQRILSCANGNLFIVTSQKTVMQLKYILTVFQAIKLLTKSILNREDNDLHDLHSENN